MGRRRGRHRARPSRTVRVLRALTATAVIGGVTLALSAFGPNYLERVWSSARADQRFVAAVQAQGRTVEPGADEGLVLSAAHKLCERRDVSVSSAERRASTLTPEEIEAVRKTFGDDSEAFIKVATRTYCP
jgi:Protein of unknown function (DUF732)